MRISCYYYHYCVHSKPNCFQLSVQATHIIILLLVQDHLLFHIVFVVLIVYRIKSVSAVRPHYRCDEICYDLGMEGHRVTCRTRRIDIVLLSHQPPATSRVPACSGKHQRRCRTNAAHNWPASITDFNSLLPRQNLDMPPPATCAADTLPSTHTPE